MAYWPEAPSMTPWLTQEPVGLLLPIVRAPSRVTLLLIVTVCAALASRTAPPLLVSTMRPVLAVGICWLAPVVAERYRTAPKFRISVPSNSRSPVSVVDELDPKNEPLKTTWLAAPLPAASVPPSRLRLLPPVALMVPPVLLIVPPDRLKEPVTLLS